MINTEMDNTDHLERFGDGIGDGWGAGGDRQNGDDDYYDTKKREKRKRKKKRSVMDGVLVVTDRTSPDTSRLTEPRK